MEISSSHHHHHHHHQLMAGAGGHALEEVLACSKGAAGQPQAQQQAGVGGAGGGGERKPRPHPDQALKCPRCESTNTKFCYYNNYSLSQPRYFCKGCRRYWTQGGSLRNVPVGGGCRKNKRSSSSSALSSSSSAATATTSASKIKLQEPAFPHFGNPGRGPMLPPMLPPSLATDHLTLAFGSPGGNPNASSAPPSGTFLDILRGGFLDAPSHNSAGANGFQSAYYGTEQDMVLPFDGMVQHHGQGVGHDKGMEHGEEEDGHGKVVMGLQWPLGGGDHAAQGLSVGNVMDSSRDYWGGGVGTASSWHGLINSSLI